MNRKQKPVAVVIASGNPGKVREIRAALPELGRMPSLADLGLAQASEPFGSFFENALAKARAAARRAGCAAIADDSGIVVRALAGAPGVRSARYAGSRATDADNNARLLADMKGKRDRSAFYYAAMVFVESAGDPAPVFAEGFWRGEILRTPRGDGGFGYDPLFWDPARGKSGAEMTPRQKNAVSHRGKSLRDLARRLRARGTWPQA